MKRKTVLFSSVLVLLLALSVVPAFAARPPEESIADVARAVNTDSGEFTILLLALEAADDSVLATLEGKGQFTVFAPTDAAFVALLGELNLTAGELLADEELVTEVLLYHVVRGRRFSNSVLGSWRLRTLQGGFLFQNGGVLTDNNDRTSNISAVDIPASNGVVHVIDTVVLP